MKKLQIGIVITFFLATIVLFTIMCNVDVEIRLIIEPNTAMQ